MFLVAEACGSWARKKIWTDELSTQQLSPAPSFFLKGKMREFYSKLEGKNETDGMPIVYL